MSVLHLGNLTDAQVEELAETILELRDPEKAIAFWHYLGGQAPDVVLRLQKHNIGLYIAGLIMAKEFYEKAAKDWAVFCGD